MSEKELSDTSSRHIVSFEENDPENPYNWPTSKKAYIVVVATLMLFNSTINTSLPAGASPQLQKHFKVQDKEQLVLPNSVFLIGFILGPLVFAPLSESNGRRKVLTGTFIMFTLATLGTCLAPNWAGFVILRLLAGVFASPPISLVGGLFADIFADPVYRGRGVAWSMIVATIGPASGPIPAGFLSPISWQWPFWFELIFDGVLLVPVLFLPETYGPEILHQRAKKIRKHRPESNTWAPIDLEKRTMREMVNVFFGRPFRMLFTEPIVTFTCLFLSSIYAILYLLFQAYVIIFGPTYGFTQGEVTLSLIPISIGALFALPVYVYWDSVLGRARTRGAAWVDVNEYQRLPLACLGGPFIPIGLFWIGWGAQKDVHWIVPMLGGLPLAFGLALTFMSFINYLVDAYRIFAASALGAASVARSTFGVVLPFATKSMYGQLGVSWACSMLGFISLVLCSIPFVFIRFGKTIRANSRMVHELEAKQNALNSNRDSV